jgi:hypothetical protein
MPIGVSEYELTRALPEDLQSALPTIEQIEAELGKPSQGTTAGKAEKPSNRRGKNKSRSK